MFPRTWPMPTAHGNLPTATLEARSSINPMRLKKNIAAAVTLCFVQMELVAGQGHWVTTWGCGPQLTEPSNLPPAPLANSTLRQFVHVTIGGKRLRVRFSNAYGTNSVALKTVH